jgi:hypothetical protein
VAKRCSKDFTEALRVLIRVEAAQGHVDDEVLQCGRDLSEQTINLMDYMWLLKRVFGEWGQEEREGLYALVCRASVIVCKIAAFVQQTIQPLSRVNIQAMAEEELSCRLVGELACKRETDQGLCLNVAWTIDLARFFGDETLHDLEYHFPGYRWHVGWVTGIEMDKVVRSGIEECENVSLMSRFLCRGSPRQWLHGPW